MFRFAVYSTALCICGLTPQTASAEMTADDLLEFCPASEDDGYCQGIFFIITQLSHQECMFALSGDEQMARFLTANMTGSSSLDLRREFTIRMNDFEFRRRFGDLPAYEGIMAAAADRWPCE